MQREPISIPKLIAYVLFSVIIFALQTGTFGGMRIFGSAVDLLPALVTAAALLGGPAEAAVVGLTVGICYDLSFTGVDGLYPLFFLLFGYAAGKLCQRLLTRNYISMLILTAFECVLLGLLRYLFSLMHAGASFLIVLRQLAVGMVLTCLLYRLPAAAQAQRQIPQAQPLTLCGKEHFPMLNKPQLLRRLLALCGLLLLCSCVALSQLFQLQILNGEKYVRRSAEFLTTTSTVSAARGEILDRYGRPLVTNNTGFSLVLIYSSFWDGNDKRFDTLLDLTHRIQTAAVDATAKQNAAKTAAATDTSSDTSADAADSTDTSSDTPTDTAQAISADTAAIPSINDRLPITQSAPFTYNSASLTELSGYMKDSAKSLGLDAVTAAVDAAKQASETDPKTDENGNTIDQAAQVDATKLVSPTEFINAMRAYMEKNLGMPTDLSLADARTMVGIYYSMRTVGFSNQATYTLADNVPMDLIAYIKEHSADFQGIEIQSEAVRQYDTATAAHLLGTIGSLTSDEWNSDKNGGPYKDKAGYQMSDLIGKSGLESALESYLHGTAGSRTVETDLGGSAIAEQTTATAPKPGDNVITTIDLDLQEVAEKSLAGNLSAYGKGGAAVALDPNTGEVLAMASYPTYDLANYNKNYASIQADSRHPEVNRATSGVYPPGSTFKMVTSIAGLEEGIISGDTYVTCTGTYEYGGQTFRCNNHDTPMTLNVTDALKYSCNTFFYTVGQKLTGEHLEQWTKKFGLGTATGIEVGEATGQAAGPTYREQQRKADPAIREWQGGDDLNAAIGQSDNGFTPLQLANYVSAIVNGGTLYKPTLVKSIKSYDYSSFMKTDESEVLGKIDISDATRELVMQGMSEVTDEGGTAGSVFADYPIKVGGKTGTAEMFENGESFDNGLFIAFAPFDNPQIVICVVGEGAGHGAYVAPIVRDMLDEYFSVGKSDSAASRQAENTLIR